MQIPHDISDLHHALVSQREYTLALYADLPSHLWTAKDVPYLAQINPPIWELSHIAWFQENFAIRKRVQHATGVKPTSCLEVADTLFDSATVAHAARWTNRYPTRDACERYMQVVLAQTLAALALSRPEDRHYFQLVLAHEDMHGEALAMTLRMLNLPLSKAVPARRPIAGASRDIDIAKGQITLGQCARYFQFDNEIPVLNVKILPFSISSEPVTANEFAAFVNSPGYTDDRYWSDEGRTWRNTWRNTLASNAAISTSNFAAMHVNFYEAEAFCASVHRRLPTEGEWEFAATSSREFTASTGHVWEWTASVFAPRAGFVRGVYEEYSEPWFHNHQVLKGSSFVTHPRMAYPQYRNFYTRERRDMFCGFRTCAVD
jgi:gamma-glutamyl hercynylcysteine S-oxide synthase